MKFSSRQNFFKIKFCGIYFIIIEFFIFFITTCTHTRHIHCSRGVFDGFSMFCSHLAVDFIREISSRAFQRCKNR